MAFFRVPLPFSPAVGPPSASYRQDPQQKLPYLIPVEAPGTVDQLFVRARVMADRLLDNRLLLRSSLNPESTIIHSSNGSPIFCLDLHIIQHYHPR